MKLVTSLDLSKNQLSNAVIQNLATAPGSPVGGQIYTNTSGGAGSYTLQFHNGTAFVSLGSGTGSGTVTSVALTMPTGFSVAGSPITSAGTFAVTTALSGLVKASAGAFVNAVSGTDYLAPTVTLNAIAAPTADVSLNSHKITSLATPTTSTDAATKGYVDGLVTGSITYRGTANASAASVDVATGTSTHIAGDEYRIATAGSTAFGFLLDVGDFVLFDGTTWDRIANTNPAVTGTTNRITVTATGDTSYAVDVSASYVGQATITTLGTVATGTWNATTIAVVHGGTGATTAAAARTNLGAPGKYTATIGDGTTTSFTVAQTTHLLASDGTILVATYDATSGARVYPDESVNNSNGTVTIAFTVAPTTNQYRILLIG